MQAATSPLKAEQNFSAALYFYQPRYCISYFYWFDKVNDINSLLFCADSTGPEFPDFYVNDRYNID